MTGKDCDCAETDVDASAGGSRPGVGYGSA